MANVRDKSCASSGRLSANRCCVWALCLVSTLAWLAGALVGTLAAAEGPVPVANPPKRLDRLFAGGATFTNVTIVEVTATHISIKSRQGFANIRIAELEPEVRSLFIRDTSPSGTATETPAPEEGGDAMPVAAREPSVGGPSSIMGKLPPMTKLIHGWVGGIVALTGSAMMLGGWLWLVGVAFRVHVGWGFAVIIGSVTCGLINLIFMVTHWEESRRPFWLYIGGILVIVLSVLLGVAAGRPTP